jgi:anti-sigma28 factor (negative regulator of flagellin synthesis)
MTIDRISINSPNVDRTQAASGAEELDKARNANDRANSVQADSLSLSGKTKEIDRVATAVEQSRTDRLNEVRRALDAGTYHVAGEDIARALIDSTKVK